MIICTRIHPITHIHTLLNPHTQVAMTRSRFPETVPFRLTRMLIHAMEGGGVEGEREGEIERE